MVKQTITPWSVEADRPDDKMVTIDYDHIITQFGCQKFTKENLESFTKLCKSKPHRYLRRNLVFSHRSFEAILECVEKNKKFFLYTGRGPSSHSMHLGHAVPFSLCKYIQEAFNVPLVIQITDDEKFLCKKMSLEEVRTCALENIKDIIAYGFNPELTYIFSNYEQGHYFYGNTLKVSKQITLNDACKVFGFDKNTNIGMIEFPARQIAASFSSSFRFLEPGMQCLIPCAVDQDPYFRLARDIALSLNEPKPASLYVSLLPDLQGTHRKMSASDMRSAVYLNDDQNTIKQKISRFAFSGGQETMEMHKRLGGDTEVDVPFQYLRYFLEDDDELERLESEYKAGSLGSGTMKKRCIEVVQAFVKEYQEKRALVTDEFVKRFMDLSKFDKN